MRIQRSERGSIDASAGMGWFQKLSGREDPPSSPPVPSTRSERARTSSSNSTSAPTASSAPSFAPSPASSSTRPTAGRTRSRSRPPSAASTDSTPGSRPCASPSMSPATTLVREDTATAPPKSPPPGSRRTGRNRTASTAWTSARPCTPPSGTSTHPSPTSCSSSPTSSTGASIQSVLPGGAPRVLPEQTPEISGIVIADPLGNFGNAELGIQNQHPGTFQPKTVHIADGRDAVCVSEDTADMGVAVPQPAEGRLDGTRRIVSRLRQLAQHTTCGACQTRGRCSLFMRLRIVVKHFDQQLQQQAAT